MRSTRPGKRAPAAGGRRAAAASALAFVLFGGAAAAFAAQEAGAEPPPTAYERRLARYRGGDFVGAVREGRGIPLRRLRGAAESFLDRRGGSSPSRDAELLAASLFHLDLAGPAETAPEEHERLARRMLARVTDPHRVEWTRNAHLGLLGFYMEYGRLEDALRVARFLTEEFRADPEARLTRGHLAALFGWMFHDERFFDQARDAYERALAAEPEAPAADLRLRLAHLVLRDGDAEGTLARLDAVGDRVADALTARQRFLSLLLRGEALLWLDRAAEAERAFSQAQAIDIGSLAAAAGLTAVRQRLGDTEGAGEAARHYLEAADGPDTWWDFLLSGVVAERARLARLRALALAVP